MRIDSFGVVRPRAWRVHRRSGASQRAIILSRNGALRVELDVLPSAIIVGGVNERLQTQESAAIESALRASHGRISGPKGAAKALGHAPSTLELRIRRLGIDKFRFRTNGD